MLQIVLMGLIESYRANGGIDDDLGLDRLYPGGDYFDPLGLADDPDSFAELRVIASLKRLASDSMLTKLFSSHELLPRMSNFVWCRL